MEIIPDIISASELENRAGGLVTCPLCGVQSTSDANDIGWVNMPELCREPKWICLGSWIDVSSISRAEDPSSHPYFDDLRRLAILCGMSVLETTHSLLQRQLDVLQSRPQSLNDPALATLQSQIESLLGNVAG